MDPEAKAENDRIWNSLKSSIDPLTLQVTGFYAALGSTRQCRHINELWHPETPAVGLGFVPLEAREKLEFLIERSGVHLHKGNGPLGRGAYFSLLHDAQLTADRLTALEQLLINETQALAQSGPPPKPTPMPSSERVLEEQVARVEGLDAVRAEEMRKRPSEVAMLVDAFNSSTMDMKPKKALALFAKAIPYFTLPQEAKRELTHTLEMMRDAELDA